MSTPRRRALALLLLAVLLGPLAFPLTASAQDAIHLRPPVTVQAAAVGQTSTGELVGTLADVSISVAEEGTGKIFLDTYPLTEVDMQGSARLAVQVAGAVTGIPVVEHDFFFVFRSGSEVIGGPSAGAVMTVGVIAALAGWSVSGNVLVTGSINPDGSIGPVGGIPQKAKAARDSGHILLFLYPEGQEAVPGNAPGDPAVNMTTYCRETLQITCQGVATIEQAVRLMTGHDLSIPRRTGEVITPSFQALMRPLAERLVQDAIAETAEADAQARALPAFVRPEERAAVEQQVQNAQASARSATEAFNASRFYTAASLCFQASIAARYALNLAAYLASNRSVEEATAIVERAVANATDAMATAKAAQVRSPSALDAVGAAQARATEAERLASTASRALSGASPDVPAALYNAAYADARSETVLWWLDIADGFTPVAGYEPRLLQAATQATATAEQSLAYARAVLRSPDAGAGPLRTAQEKLQDARRDSERRLYAAALHEALEAQVRAGAALQLAPGADPGRLAELNERARQNAESAILTARDAGGEPVLAVSYYELAGDLAGRSPADALVYYQLARTLASVGDLLRDQTAPRASRFVGLPDVDLPPWLSPTQYLGVTFALGLGVGVLLAIVALGALTDRFGAFPGHKKDDADEGTTVPDEQPLR